MIYFAITFVFMLLVIVFMAIGVILGRKAIKGSCGGANQGNCICIEKCDKRKKQEAKSQTSVVNTDLIS